MARKALPRKEKKNAGPLFKAQGRKLGERGSSKPKNPFAGLGKGEKPF